MIIRIKRKRLELAYYALMALFLLSFSFIGITFVAVDVLAGNTTNATVLARVNVSNAPPYLYLVQIVDPLDSAGNVDLQAGNVTTVLCNGSFQDDNGFDDLVSINATLFMSGTSSIAADDNNTHYTNRSCGVSSCSPIPDSNNLNGTCTCQFAVQYYVNPGSWSCNMTVSDIALSSTNQSAAATFNQVLGIEAENLVVDFGNLSVTQTSKPIRENVTNAGNVPMNFTVRGYGGTNESVGQNLSMICDPTASTANISIGSLMYDTINSTPFATMVNLTNKTMMVDKTIPKRTLSRTYGNSSNSTFWRLQIPLGAGGICNGTIVFGAVQDFN